ncbi:uncharacterized protein LOC132886578 [Neoarius graeffei]|uniref:uncharacterized protein LOC132886578 n=1 Tax=Neoarius graeffei TaxID=443677 RepID=UPI00298D2B1D|nr:uncharacterized protein LOC132886578 [Neoarius graeffei]
MLCFYCFRPRQLVSITSLSKDDQMLLKHRCSLQDDVPPDATICLYHKKINLDCYSSLQKNCSNPYGLHARPMKKNLRIISLSQAEAIGKTSVKAGMKEDIKDQLDKCFTAIGLSPCKISRVSPRDKEVYIKRKVEEVGHKTKEMLHWCAAVPSTSWAAPMMTTSSADVSDVGYLVTALKQKLSITTGKQEQIKLLTLVPQSWSIAKTIDEFGVSERLVRRARDLRLEHGILPVITPSIGRPLSTDTVNKVIAFFHQDDISRPLPGKKDFKSVKEGDKRVHKQKRLIVMNLNEAFQLFKQSNPDLKIGISKFCSLRPKECITVGARGTHCVFVCTTRM